MRNGQGVDGIQFADVAEHAMPLDCRLLRRDLHDSVGPLLSALMMRTEAARATITCDPEAAKKMLGEVHADACHALAEVRRLASTEPAFAPRERRLASALRCLADRFSPAPGGRLNVSVAVAPAMETVPAAVQTAIYRIASEALTNTARHALARSCTIRAWADGTGLHVEVADDGAGLPRRPAGGVGLNSMRDRARELGGTCVVENVVPHGTRVYATFPTHSPEYAPAGAAAPARPERQPEGT